ncbi:WD repeat-containing protein 26 [Thelohanellus kitauei]|uniref:WD repeat-containing protein 26 n=1 Tax=Thelohanellus kitauei TaxID=669202 RepID=A0A0C2MAY6_THEKT|nr:WD repeat-containing protein 26 [Thelohanellus kitauei]
MPMVPSVLTIRSDIPSSIIQRFEVPGTGPPTIAFSNNGQFLAIKPMSFAIHVFRIDTKINKFVEYKTFNFDAVPLSFKWSPDDTKLLVTLSPSRYLIYVCKLQDKSTVSDVVIQTPSLTEEITCVAWFPDSLHYVVGTNEGIIYIFDIYGHTIDKLKNYRSMDINVLKDGETILFTDNLNRLLLWNPRTHDIVTILQSNSFITSVLLCPNGENALISCINEGIFLFNLRYKSIVRHFYGIVSNYQASQCSFYPLENSKLFAVGDQMGSINIYHIDKSPPIHNLRNTLQHPCSAIAWNPTDPTMLASVTIDCIVNIWQSNNQHPRFI